MARSSSTSSFKKWGFNASAVLTGREGYPIPYFIGRVTGFAEGSLNTNIQATTNNNDFSNACAASGTDPHSRTAGLGPAVCSF